MLRKIWSIAYKDLYITFTDRTALLIMFATPLTLAVIIGLVFSGFISNQGSDVPVQNIPVVVVNLDEGVIANNMPLNQGQLFVDILVPQGEHDPDNTLHQLTDAVQGTDAAAARAGVDDGTYRAAIIIPPEFSRSLTVSAEQRQMTPTSVEVYANPASPVSASIISSITESLANQIALGNISIAATIDALTARAVEDPAFGVEFGAAAVTGEFNPDFSAAFDPAVNPIQIEQQSVSGETAAFNPLVLFGSSQAVFFMMFTAMAGGNALLEERRDGTLQRQLVSPTPRIALLLGKFLGTLITCIAQVTLLFLGLTLVGSVLAGELKFIWGSNFLLIGLTILCVSLAASGIGALIASIVRTPEQGNTVGTIVAMLIGLFGGAFFSVETVPIMNIFSRFTINYWGVNAFTKLSQGQTDIGLNLLILLILGVVFFAIGMFSFNRQLDV